MGRVIRFGPMSDSELIPPGEAAGRLGVTVKTLRRWVDLGHLTPVRTPGGHYRYRATEIQSIYDGTLPVEAAS